MGIYWYLARREPGLSGSNFLAEWVPSIALVVSFALPVAPRPYAQHHRYRPYMWPHCNIINIIGR